MRERYALGSTVRLYLDIISAGAGVISQTPTVSIQRRIDDKWLQVSDGTWVAAIVDNPMTQTDSVFLPGRYHFDFDQSLDLEMSSREYIVKLANTAPDQLEYRDLVFGSEAAAVAPELCSVQGTLYGAQGTPLAGALVRATLVPVYKDGLGRAVESDRVVLTYSDGNGDFDLPLVRGGIFRLEINAVGFDRKVTIPDQASVLFTDL